MPKEIVLDLDVLLAWSAVIVGVGGAIGYLIKASKPFMKPFQKLQKDVQNLENQSKRCEEKFEHDQTQLQELKEDVEDMKTDIKMLLEASLLNMRHIETGNCTGDIAKGRIKLEKYLINR